MARAAHAVFGRPLLQDEFMFIVIEAIVSTALCPEWFWRSRDDGLSRFEHLEGTTLEVKACSALDRRGQLRTYPARWHQHYEPLTVANYPHLKNADLYVLALHTEIHPSFADYRDVTQWRFYVVESDRLPGQSRIEIAAVERLTAPEKLAELAASVAWARRMKVGPVAADETREHVR